MKDLDEFTQAYIACALWSTNDESTLEGGVPFDGNYSEEDIHPDMLVEMIADCRAFQDQNKSDINAGPHGCQLCQVQSSSAQAGHDFWLTRNGHGAGFWDGDWPIAAGKRLTKASEEAGDVTLYLGEDDLIHH